MARLAMLVWPQLLIVLLLIVAEFAGARLEQAARAYIAGCGIWSRAQASATHALIEYIETGRPLQLARFEDSLAPIRHDRRARLAMELPEPDLATARTGLIAGGNHADDVEGMITLFLWFRWVPDVQEAVTAWKEGDALIARLEALAALPAPPPAQRAELRRQVEVLDASLKGQEHRFEQAVSAAARDFSRFLLLLQALVGIGLILVGARMASKLIAHARASSQAMSTLNERLQVSSENSRTGVWALDLRQRTLYTSERLQAMLGLPCWPVRNLHAFVSRVHPADLPEVQHALRSLRQGMPVGECRLRLSLPDGWRWFALDARVTRGPDNRRLRCEGGLTDITGQVLAEFGLYASEQLARSLLRAAPDAIIVVDAHGCIVSANPAAGRTFGTDPSSLIGQHYSSLHPPMTPDAATQVLREAVGQGPVASTAQHADGHSFPIELSLVAFDQNGQSFHAAFVRDVSERHRLDKEFHRARHLLDASQSLARVGGWEESFEDDDTPVYWTDQMYRLLELSPDSFRPGRDSLLAFLAPESVGAMKAALLREVWEGVPHDLELVMVTARGRRFWAHSRSSLVLDGELLRKRTATVRDITLQKTSQQAQRQAWALQKRTAEQLELALKGAQLALWAFEIETGRITHAQRWELFGYQRVPGSFEAWKSMVHPEDIDARLSSLDRYFAGTTDADDAEYRMRHADGHWVWVRGRGQVVSRGSRGEPLQYAGVVMDMSAQVAAREVVRDQRHFLQTMVDGIDTGVVVSDEHAIVYMNASLRRALGHDAGSALEGHPTDLLFAPADLALEHERRDALARGIAVPVALSNLRSRQGTLVRMALNTSRVLWNGQAHFITTATPLSEQDMLEAQIRATQVRFERVLISELEAQQAHIARELHDSLGSELAGLSLVLGGARQAVLSAAPALAPHLDGAMRQVKVAVEVTRALARGLTPVSETPGGLVQALDRLARDYTVVMGVRCELVTSGELDAVPHDVGNHLYRIAQEALANAVRHGGATTLELRLVNRGGHHRLSVLDNGSGFDPRRVHQGHIGLGLRSMMARAKVVGGRVQFQPRAGRGTEVRVMWSPEPSVQDLSTGT